jgi:putative glycosyltransferase (TIGR04372 family)
MRFREITLDGGLSRLKWQLRDDLTYDMPVDDQTYLWQVSKSEGLRAWKAYFQLRAQTESHFPLRDGIGLDLDLVQFLGGTDAKLALFHVKREVSNATAAPTAGEAYVPAMEYLRDLGYKLVFVGREVMPAEFRELGVLNYAQSPIASYRHDLQLFAVASIAVTAGSGIAFLPDCMGMPYVYADSWHVGMPMFSPRCVILPALVRDRLDGHLLTFEQQADLYWSLPDDGHESFPAERFEARNASGDEILEAVKEALSSRDQQFDSDPLQQSYKDVDARGLLPFSKARVGAYFLRKHQSLLGCSSHMGAPPRRLGAT